MKNRRFKPAEMVYEYKIGYSQGVILFDVVIGFFLIFGGIALAIWIKSWLFPFWSLFGVFSIWRAIKRFRQQGPQIKIGQQGIWTVATSYLSWGRALPLIKMEVGYRSVSTSLVILNRFNQQQELARLSIRELDVNARTLQAYINEFAPKL